MIQQEIITGYGEIFTDKSVIVRSPGRINLIGEHTDYNNGFVLPAAIDKAAYVGIIKRSDNEIHLYAADINESHQTQLDELFSPQHHWSAYLLGVVDQLRKNGYEISGFEAVLKSDVPVGAGMSSSAAIECACIAALNELFELNIDKLSLVKLAQKAENEFVGVQCGIMDMFASVMGKKNMAIQLDCRSLQYEYFPLELNDYRIVLFDTGVKHSLAGGEYNLRRKQCEEGVAVLNEIYPSVKSLRDVNMHMIEMTLKEKVDEVIYKRCRYVVEENHRLLSGCILLQRNDIAGFGKKMFATHKGLSEDYEVSCPELDALVNWVKTDPEVAGARMMGGGFGGCTINLIKNDVIDKVIDRLQAQYQTAFGKELKVYVTTPQDGTTITKSEF